MRTLHPESKLYSILPVFFVQTVSIYLTPRQVHECTFNVSQNDTVSSFAIAPRTPFPAFLLFFREQDKKLLYAVISMASPPPWPFNPVSSTPPSSPMNLFSNSATNLTLRAGS